MRLLILSNFFYRASGQYRRLVEIFTVGILIFAFHQQPRVGVVLTFYFYDMVGAFQLFAIQHCFNVAFGQHLLQYLFAFLRIVRSFCQKSAGIPNHDGAAAILPFWNSTFKVDVVHRMILHMHGQTFYRCICRRAFGNRPAYQCTINFKAVVIVQA